MEARETTPGGWKQPHEDVIGVARDDDLLSLDDRAIAHREALVAMAMHLHAACLVGNPAPVVQRMYERITNPQPGDLVIETTSRRVRDPETRRQRFGILLAQRREWWQTDAEWEAAKAEDAAEDGILTDADRLTDDAWYVQYGPAPGDVCRWVNCQFIALPTGEENFRTPVGQRDGSGVTITRDSLIGAMVDSGFALRSPERVEATEDTP